MDENLIKIIKNVDSHMRLYYNIPLYEMDIAESEGYWRDKKVCDPATCRSPLHNCMGCEGGIQHTMTYKDHHRGAKGQFKSIHSSWTVIKKATDEGIVTDKILKQILENDQQE